MPTYTVEAFQWTGTYYNAQYTSSVTATFSDNDASYAGGGDSDEQVQINNGSFNATNGEPYNISVSFTDTSGNAHVEDFAFFNTTDGGWFFVPGPDSEFTVGATLGSYQSHTLGWNYDDVVCFVTGTKIATPNGPTPVESLKAGDLVNCHDGVARPLQRVLSQSFTHRQLADNEKLRPVCITAGALGNGLPTRDLWVSRQHRFLADSPVAKRLSQSDGALIAAIKLCALPGIFQDNTPRDVTYFHLDFEDHQIIYAEGAYAESLLSDMASEFETDPELLEELELLLPQAGRTDRAIARGCVLPTPRQQKDIVSKLQAKGKPMWGL